jgi:hypothetical protein
MSYRTGPKIVTDGLVLCLDAADRNSYPGSGSTWYDLSGNGNNGTLTNSPTFNSNGYFTFNSSNNRWVELDTALSFSSAFTMTCFFTKSNSTDSRSFLGKDTGVTSGTKIIFLPTDLFFMRMIDNGDAAIFDIGYDSSMNNSWHFVAALRTSANVCKASLDGGNLVSGGTQSGTFAPNAIGRNFASQYWDGNFADMKMYNRELTLTEIQQNYNALKGRFGL